MKCAYHDDARIVVVNPEPVEGVGDIVVVTAGTSDIPVAEEAAITAEVLGNKVKRIYDVGVAGIHRLLNVCDDLFKANVAVVVAGMEGALASVVGGLVSCPVIGVPTSIGYGASFKRRRRPSQHAQQLRLRRLRGQHRQRLRRGLPSESHQQDRHEARLRREGEYGRREKRKGRRLRRKRQRLKPFVRNRKSVDP